MTQRSRYSEVVAAATVMAAAAAYGRAGGGEHAGVSTSASSRGHSSSFGSGGGSLGGIVALVIIALVVWYFAKRMRQNAQARPNLGGTAPSASAQAAISAVSAAFGAAALARPGMASPSGPSSWRPALPSGVEVIRTQDPGFETESFLQRAEMTFFLVKRGMQHNDSTAVRPYLDDAVFGEVARFITQMKGQHRHALYESLNVRAVHLDDVTCTAESQSIQVHFDLVYRLKTLDDTNHVIADDGTDGRHGERWTFRRGANAHTSVSGDVTASRCPACGAELRLNLDGTCAHCRANVTNGTVDWVVADVRPAPFIGYSIDSPMAAAAASVPVGIASLCAADPAFSVDRFIARAKQAFLTLQDAWCRQNLDAGRAFLSPGAYFTWSAQLEALAAEGRRNVMENVELDRIEIVRIVHGRVFDDLTVRLLAKAADFEIDKDNRVVFGDRQVRPFAEEWTFQRSIGVETTGKPGTLENACPNCGAPLTLTQIGECRYCKAAVTSGKFDWVVSRIEQEVESDPMQDDDRPRADLALQVGGAIVGGLLSSLLSGKSSDN